MVAETPEYLVTHGKTAVLGSFAYASPEPLQRGQRVVVLSERGLALGSVLTRCGPRHKSLLGPGSGGRILRQADAQDLAAHRGLSELENAVFAAARAIAREQALPLQVIDVECALDGSRAILQYLSPSACEVASLVEALARQHQVEIWLENLAAPTLDDHDSDHEHGCGKPDCGSGSGGCSTCSTGGGCSSCGSGGTDLKAYFSQLRDKRDQRHPLL